MLFIKNKSDEFNNNINRNRIVNNDLTVDDLNLMNQTIIYNEENENDNNNDNDNIYGGINNSKKNSKKNNKNNKNNKKNKNNKNSKQNAALPVDRSDKTIVIDKNTINLKGFFRLLIAFQLSPIQIDKNTVCIYDMKNNTVTLKLPNNKHILREEMEEQGKNEVTIKVDYIYYHKE